MTGKYKANNKPAPIVEKNPIKYLALVKPWGLSLLEPKAKRTELTVKRTTQLRFWKVIFCLTMITDRMRLNTS